MDKAVLIMQDHPQGIHNGHRELIRFAKSQVDELIVGITPDYHKWIRYLVFGEPYRASKKILRKQVMQLKAMGIDHWYMKRKFFISRPRRLLAFKMAKEILAPHEEQLLFERYKTMATAGIMGYFLRSQKRQYDLVIRGPEVVNFFFDHISDRTGWPRTKFLRRIVKNQGGLKYQSSLKDVDEADQAEIKRISDEVKSFLKKGDNFEIINEINRSYDEKKWDMKEATIFEGGFVKGRIEVVSFKIGNKTIEDIDYYE